MRMDRSPVPPKITMSMGLIISCIAKGPFRKVFCLALQQYGIAAAIARPSPLSHDLQSIANLVKLL